MEKEMTSSGIDRQPLLRKIANGQKLVYHRSFLDYIHMCLLLLLSIALILWYYVFVSLPVKLPTELFVPLTMLAVIIHMKFNRKYVVSVRGISFKRGILSLHRKEQAISYAKMRSVEIQQNLFQRILNVADLGITTILGDQPEMKIRGIYRPRELATVIEYFIAEKAKQYPKEGGGVIQQQIPVANYVQ